jgi:hypothetical protein
MEPTARINMLHLSLLFLPCNDGLILESQNWKTVIFVGRMASKIKVVSVREHHSMKGFQLLGSASMLDHHTSKD